VIRAILRAQFLSLRNMRLAGWQGTVFSLVTSLLWYGVWVTLASAAYGFTSEPDGAAAVRLALPRGLAFVFVYWQVAPLLLASMGASLDMQKLLVYPVPPERLFWVEVTLRLTTGIEMVILLGGAASGMVANPRTGGWLAADRVLPACLVFIAANLLLASGVRSLLERILAYKRLREAIILLLVIGLALPSIVLRSPATGGWMRQILSLPPNPLLPWSATAHLMISGPDLFTWAVLLVWTAAFYIFGRWQFACGLRFDASARNATTTERRGERNSAAEFAFRLPGRFLPDPVGALVEKEMRTLARTPRFRLVFIMGFTFGLLIWLPVVLHGDRQSALAANFLTLVCVYAVTLLGQVSYWNAFGFDRSAVQAYFCLPVGLGRVLVAKNIAAAIYVALEVVAITLACLVLRVRLSPLLLLEAYSVTIVFGLILISAGNLTSVHLPRSMNPERTTQGGGGGRTQAMVLFVYPVAGIPILLAYLGRWALDSEAAFFGILAVSAAAGAIFYWVAMDSALRAAEQRREAIVTELAHADGPVSSE